MPMRTASGACDAAQGPRSRPTVLAVIVSYNPGPDFPENLRALRAQVDDVVVVDNASSDFEGGGRAWAAGGCRILANESNLGIAAALNQGVGEALLAGADWLATLDQDSRVPDGAILRLLEVV